MSRNAILDAVRAALGRSEKELAPDPPPVRLRIPDVSLESRIASMTTSVEALAGRVLRAPTPKHAGRLVRERIANQNAVASNSPYLDECGIRGLPNVHSGITKPDELQKLCAAADVGITGVDYALADTGTLVVLSSPYEARMISLLPPAHLAVMACSRLLTGLDELFTLLPDPAVASSSMVFITGPSRTADIEQILVRGVHGPGEIVIILVG